MGNIQSVGSLVQDYSYRTKNQRNSSIAIVKDGVKKISANEADAIIKDCKDRGLIDDEKYEPFFYKKLYEHGKSKFLQAAEKAIKYNKQGAGRMFTHLLS